MTDREFFGTYNDYYIGKEKVGKILTSKRTEDGESSVWVFSETHSIKLLIGEYLVNKS